MNTANLIAAGALIISFILVANELRKSWTGRQKEKVLEEATKIAGPLHQESVSLKGAEAAVVVLDKALARMSDENDQLRKRVTELEAINEQLEARVEALERKI